MEPISPSSASLAVGLGAALGANARYWSGAWAGERWGGAFPWATLVINVVGSLILGAALEAARVRGWGQGPRLFLGAGFAGGFTTFSAFSRETLTLLEGRQYAIAAAYASASVVLAIGACAVGARMVR